jgi:hypothetical protein
LSSFEFVYVVKNASRDADGENRELADRLVLDAARDVDDDTRVKLDGLVVEDHGSLTADDVIDFVGLGVVVKFGVVDLDVMDLGGCLVVFCNEWTDLAAGLGPRGDIGGIAAEAAGGNFHEKLRGLRPLE